jgi:hypothetical protein
MRLAVECCHLIVLQIASDGPARSLAADWSANAVKNGRGLQIKILPAGLWPELRGRAIMCLMQCGIGNAVERPVDTTVLRSML